MYRRDLTLKVGGYRPSYAPADDLDLWLRLLNFGDMANLPDEIVMYRQHPNQTSRENLKRQSFAKARVYWDRKSRQSADSFNLDRWQQIRFTALSNSEWYIVNFVDQFRDKNYRRAILFFFLATLLNPVSMWQHIGTYMAVQRAKILKSK
jgi:hypothetical protein